MNWVYLISSCFRLQNIALLWTIINAACWITQRLVSQLTIYWKFHYSQLQWKLRLPTVTLLQTQELMIGRVTGNEKLHTRYPRSYVPRILETRYPYLRNHLPCTPSSRLCTCTLETITSTRNLTNRWNNSPMFAYWKEKHNSGSICLSHVTCCAILILILKSQGLHLS